MSFDTVALLEAKTLAKENEQLKKLRKASFSSHLRDLVKKKSPHLLIQDEQGVNPDEGNRKMANSN